MGKDFQKRLKNSWPYLLLIVACFFLYSYCLDKVPVHLNQDEMEYSLNAYSIAKTLRDQSGKLLPFYFWHLGFFWSTPIVAYSAALFLKFLPLSEATIRLPSVFVGLSVIILAMVLAKKEFSKRGFVFLAGILTATTPLLFIHSRLLLDNLYLVPFVFLWLIFLKGFLEKEKTIYLFLSGLFLGIGLHSYHAAKIFMPLYFLITTLLFWRKMKSRFLAFALGFSIPIILFIPWLIKYPDTLLHQVRYAGLIDKSINTEEGIWGVFNPSRIGQFLTSYPTYLGPKILFVSGDRSLIHSTQKSGAFLFPLMFLLVFGIVSVLFKKKDVFSKLVLIGFLTYPLAPSLINDPSRISRGLTVIPFTILLSLYGFEFLLSFRERALKGFSAGIIIFVFLQFGIFVKGYFTDYPKESYAWFNGNIGGVLESAIKNTKIRKVNNIYTDENIYFIERYVKFYSIKNSSDLESRVLYFDPATEDFSSLPIYSLVIISANDFREATAGAGNFEKTEGIFEPDGSESFFLYYRDR